MSNTFINVTYLTLDAINMDPKFEMLLLQFEQPDKSVWDEILSFAENWNRTKENKFINDEPSELAIYFSEEDDKELKELENILEEKHEERQWAWIKTITNDPTKEEIEAHASSENTEKSFTG